MAEQVFYVEDHCCLKSDPSRLGIVERTVQDVDSHVPQPQRDYDEKITRHKDISATEFKAFMKTGIPTAGSVLVLWQDMGTELVPTTILSLVDRSILVGDVVKKNPQDAMSGTVVGTRVACTVAPFPIVQPLRQNQNGDPDSFTWTSIDELKNRVVVDPSSVLYTIPAEELCHAEKYGEGDLVIYRDWIGRVKEVHEKYHLILSDGSFVIPADSDELELVDLSGSDRIEVGSIVEVGKRNLRQGMFLHGAYNPLVDSHAIVVHVELDGLSVHWLCRRLDGPASRVNNEPPEDVEPEQIASSDFHHYDRSRCPRNSSQDSRDACCVDWIVGQKLRFKDPAGAALKYDGSTTTKLRSGEHKNHFHRTINTSTTHGYDLDVLVVLSTRTVVKVCWQDLTTSVHESTEVIPDINIEDESEVWPGEIVVSVQRKTPPREDHQFEFARVGVVQSVKAADRIANVRWLPHALVLYHNLVDLDDTYSGALLPGSTTGLRSDNDPVEEVSIYDIRIAPGINKRRGDFVMLHPPADGDLRINRSATLDWFGEVIDLGLDGLLTVRLGALDEVRDVCVAPEYATLAFSSDMVDESFSDGGSFDDELSDMDDISRSVRIAAHSLGIAQEARELWYEYEDANGQRRTVAGDVDEMSEDESWSTEGESEGVDEDEDVSFTGTGAPSPATEVAVSTFEEPNKDRMSIDQTQPQESLIPTNAEDSPAHFDILDESPPADCPYVDEASSPSTSLMRRIRKEHQILASSLPPGIFVRTWESRLDLLRIMILGPLDTPYEFAPFVIDMKLPSDYPHSAPEAFFHSWTQGQGPVNPNLYENGKICLSLLGTWHADASTENWNPTKSTVLQILVSILGLVLVKEPYYNEAGFEVRAGSAESHLPSKLYSERTYFRSRRFITHALQNKVEGFDEVIRWLYLDNNNNTATPQLLRRAINAAKELIECNENPMAGRRFPTRGGLSSITKGALVMLKRQLSAMEKLVPGQGGTASAEPAVPPAENRKYIPNNETSGNIRSLTSRLELKIFLGVLLTAILVELACRYVSKRH
jgi:ubiquitin-conjugating enzyme E2 O